MSIVLHGFGLGEVDSGSSLVTYGLARDLDQGETIEQAVASTGIENLFVVDFSAGQRKPTAAEFRLPSAWSLPCKWAACNSENARARRAASNTGPSASR